MGTIFIVRGGGSIGGDIDFVGGGKIFFVYAVLFVSAELASKILRQL